DVEGEEALVGAEALRVADELPGLVGLLAVPDLLEVVVDVADVAELAVDQELAREDVAVREHAGTERGGVARDLVGVRLGDLGDEAMAHDALRVDEVGERERVVPRER